MELHNGDVVRLGRMEIVLPDMRCGFTPGKGRLFVALLLGHCDAKDPQFDAEKALDEMGWQRKLQARVSPWMQACFGPEISADRVERNHRFAEEALELVQSLGMPKADALALVDYVYDRPAGDPPQEVGGVMITLAALCLAAGMDMHAAGETELTRIWTCIDKIRAKQANKPKGSALPVAVRHG